MCVLFSDYIAARIPKTNLLLVVLRAFKTSEQSNANCTSGYSSPGCLAPISPPPAIPVSFSFETAFLIDLNSSSFDLQKTESCYQPFRETPRLACHKHHAEEDSSKCTMQGGSLPRCTPLLPLLCFCGLFAFALSLLR